MKEYGKNAGSPPHLETLKAAFIVWANEKGDAESSERNRDGAITDLMNQLMSFDQTHRPAAHWPVARHQARRQADGRGQSQAAGQGHHRR